ncbi:hypothetical protein G647_06797 [Cladophialophora carrionii CBS 160.54]|uniref:Heterokaryon incompatibility domain-containing protein n=1 Tax=Cladophialophora carrionii CBS 160.54 TaxID=1279043 RepID=V9D7S6_9EURO|nr:uncharacterized protein G647_06797 [Cladophialophora carrionii CBS 160.54]ETI22721.1 hypothetical protein G647_06797 [Cladophialophora carrionii CBS 160.54]
MDHLYENDRGSQGGSIVASCAPIQVPFLCEYEYDHDCEFTEYPSQKGFDKHKFLGLDFSQRPPDETASFLQTWLYFGLLGRVLRVPLTMEDFVDRTSTPPTITTRRSLPSYLEAWAKKVKAKHVQQMEADLEEARSFVLCMLEAGHACPLPKEVVLSIMVLGATLSFAIDLKIESFPPKNKTVIADWGMSPLITARLVRNGWCINDVHRLCDTVSPPTALLAADIVRQEVVSRETHDVCSPAGCISRNIDESTYETKHVDPGCQCDSVAAPVDQVKAILDQGDVPVILVREEGGGHILGLEASSSRKTKFIAISHVWADGLGCTTGNSLPSCQLLRLHRMCSDLFPERTGASRLFRRADAPLGLWIDTLCIPREKAHRRLAIARMSATYAGAAKVLILDSELLSLTKDMPERTILLRLIGSSWDRRVWTMQEGALGASGLHVKLADGVLDVSDAVKRLQKSSGSGSLATAVVDRDATILFQEFEQLRKAHSKSYWRDGVPAIAASLRILNGRSTSKEGDAYICLAGMMALEGDIIKDLDATPVQERTRKLLSSVRYLPKNIIFSPGVKLEEEGFRWACASFWKSKFTFNELNEVAEIREGLGLRVEFQGFEIEAVPLRDNYFLFQSVHTKIWYRATLDGSTPLSRPTNIAPGSTLGILCPERDIIRRGAGGRQVPAALVLITARKSGLKDMFSKDANALHCTYISQVVLSTPTAADMGGDACRTLARRPNNTQEPPGMGIVYTPQIWYVS